MTMPRRRPPKVLPNTHQCYELMHDFSDNDHRLKIWLSLTPAQQELYNVTLRPIRFWKLPLLEDRMLGHRYGWEWVHPFRP